jgi:uncharacterized protein (TIGR02594 family)
MTALPATYRWLDHMPTRPRMIDEALKLFGTVETPGSADNPVILGWAAEVGLGQVYSDDAIPWCGLFMAVVAKRAGKAVPGSPLWAKSWAAFGRELTVGEAIALGDVLVFNRPGGGGHVALYIGHDDTAYHVLGGNQSDAVTITRIAKSRLHRARRPIYTRQPVTAAPYRLAAAGVISGNEA